MRNPFKKKFKVRVAESPRDDFFYCVQYCYYRLIPVWHTIKWRCAYRYSTPFYYDNGWRIKEFGAEKEAQEYARTFKTYKDVERYWREQDPPYKPKVIIGGEL